MSKLISEIEAFTAWKNGEDVEIHDESMCWHALHRDHSLCVFDSNGRVKFRLKPKTITMNGIEVPAPFEPKVGEKYWFIADYVSSGYSDTQEGTGINSSIGKWRTKEEIKQVVAALRSILKGE